jgi:VanZ family protein
MVPILDETIQIFVPGRSAAVIDMMIDLSGYLTGLLIMGSINALLNFFSNQRVK